MEKFFERIPFIDEILKGISQIMLQENRWTGLLFLSGMAIGNWRYAAAAVLASAMGTLTAKVLKLDKELIKRGIFGFNPALVGVTLNFLFASTVLVWVLIICAGGILTVLLHQYLIQKKIIPYTLPFVIASWILFVVLEYVVKLDHSHIVQYLLPVNEEYGNYLAVISGFGEVIFQQNLLASLLIFLGVYISVPVTAVYGVAASLLASLFSQIAGMSSDQIFSGLFGFNAVLTAVAFSGSKKKDGFWVLVGSVITIFINIFLVRENLLALVGGPFTLPFILGTWITLWLKNKTTRTRLSA